MAESAEHEQLIDICRFDVAARLREMGLGLYVIVDQGAILSLTDQSVAEALIPDAIMVSGPHACFIEVGDYTPDKYSPLVPVVHVGFSGAVSIVNPRGTAFEILLMQAMEECLTEWAPVSTEGC